MDTVPIEVIQQAIGYTFKNSRLLTQAFTRSSFSKEHPEFLDNEQLEFYGDEALDYYVAQAMCTQFSETTKDGQFLSKKTEQELTEIKSYNVDTESLAHCIEITGFQNYLLMNESDKKNKTQNSPSVMADLFEAIIGAVAVDSDWNYTKISNACKNMLKLLNFDINYIKWLAKWCAEQEVNPPVYQPIINHFASSFRSQQTFDRWPPASYQLSFFSGQNREDSLGISLCIKDLNLEFEFRCSSEYVASMECAKKAYEAIRKNELKQSVGDPSFDTAINQLNILYQKGYINEPEYLFTEDHDKDGNPIWHCDCVVDEDMFHGDSYQKKQAKKEAAFGALCELLEYTPEVSGGECYDELEDDDE